MTAAEFRAGSQLVIDARVAPYLARAFDLLRAEAHRDAVVLPVDVVEVAELVAQVARAQRARAAAAAGAATGSATGSVSAKPGTELAQSGAMTTTEAAEAHGISERAIRKAIECGRLRAVRDGRRFLLDPSDVAAYTPRTPR